MFNLGHVANSAKLAAKVKDGDTRGCQGLPGAA